MPVQQTPVPGSAQAFIQSIQNATQNNSINVNEMQAILHQATADGVITDGEKQALRALLFNNGALFTEEARRELEAWLTTYSTAGDTVVTSPGEAFDQLRQHFNFIASATGISNSISRADLTTIINDPNSSPALVASCRFLQSHFNTFANLAGGGGAGAAQVITLRDLQVAQHYHGLTCQTAYQTLLQHWNYLDTAGNGAADQRINRASLEAVLANPNAPNELKAAARLLLNSATIFNRVDGAYDGRDDNSIRRIDVEVAIAREDMSFRSAVTTLVDGFATIAGNDGRMTPAELLHFIRHTPSSAALAAAADILHDNPALWREISGGGNHVTVAQLQAWLTRNPLTAVRLNLDPAQLAPQQVQAPGNPNIPNHPNNGVHHNGVHHNGGPNQGAGLSGPNGNAYRPPALSVLDREIDNVLTDPGLTVEDKVTLVLMLIAKYMDKQIEQQLEKIRTLQLAQQQSDAARAQQTQQNNQNNQVQQTQQNQNQQNQNQVQPNQQNQQNQNQQNQNQVQPNQQNQQNQNQQNQNQVQPNQQNQQNQNQVQQNQQNQQTQQPNNSDTSIDVEATKLKRLIDKRSQMFDMLRQIVDKYNQTAKSMIDSIGR